MAEKWIQKAINPQHKGALRRKLGVKSGQKIPEGKLRTAAAKGGTTGKQARLAETLRGLRR